MVYIFKASLARLKSILAKNNCTMLIGPCVIANQGGTVEYECAPDGSFKPLQCESAAEDLLRCFCVNPSDGTPIANTEVTVASRDDAPDCDHLGGYLNQ